MKSGTSLLRVLLGQHRRLYSTFESHWFTDDVRINWDNIENRRISLLIKLFDLSLDEYQLICDEKRKNVDIEFIDIVFRYCTTRADKSRWVDKTPYNIRYFDLITDEWSGAKLIHVTREYKDTFASWKLRRGDDITTFLNWSSVAYEKIESLLGTKTHNYYEIDYFDLVVKTRNAMRSVLEYIDEEWDEACAEIVTKNTEEERVKIKKIINRESLTSVSLAKPIFTKSICQWKNILTKNEADIIEREFARYYEVFGAGWERYEQFCESSGDNTSKG